ncbi:MAG: LysM peptidoglycan-binding domain-containing protein [Anaerolineae bacterium]|nr:LysM peptidoglycan-binding domain-containing protein [Anaerolineae bacterium]
MICTECGTRQKARPARVRCRYCGRRASIELTVCPHCGRDLKPAGFPWRWLAYGLVVAALAWGIYTGRNLITPETFVPVQRLFASLLRPLPTLVAIITPTPTEPPPTPTATPTGPTETPTSPPATPTPNLDGTLVLLPTATSRPPVTVTMTVSITGTTLPGGTITATLRPTGTASVTTTGTVQPQTPEAAATGPRTTPIKYKVQPGDNLTLIAARFGVTVEAIIAANNLRNPERLQVDQELIIPPPDATLAPAATPTRRPVPVSTSTPTPSIIYPAPQLREPPDGDVFSSGKSAIIILRWEPGGALAADEWYAVRLRYLVNGVTQFGGANVKEISWRVPEDYFGKADQPDRIYQWDVAVVRLGPDNTSREVSPRSATRTFRWP